MLTKILSFFLAFWTIVSAPFNPKNYGPSDSMGAVNAVAILADVFFIILTGIYGIIACGVYNVPLYSTGLVYLGLVSVTSLVLAFL